MTSSKIEPSPDWRRLLRQYQEACREDSLEGIARSTLHREYLFLQSHGTAQFIEKHREDHESIPGPSLPKPPESYVAVTETIDRVVAEIPPVRAYDPEVQRIVLLRLGETWAIQDILWPCFCGRLSMPGKCDFCRGKGVNLKPAIEKRLFGLLTKYKLLEEKCSSCHGTGACRSCKSSGMPGWESRYGSKERGED